MVIVGVLLIVAVLLDAWRRMRSDGRQRVNLDLVDPQDLPPERDIDLAWLKELPNGGARVVERGDLLKAAGMSAASGEDNRTTASQGADEGGDGLIGGLSSADGDDEHSMDWLDGVDKEGEKRTAAGTLPRGVDPQVFMLNVVARHRGGFRGDDIMQILLACDLRFGDMNFFHRHEYAAGRGAIQFSVANMMKPGVFDIDNMQGLTTPGLVFFVTLPGPDDMMQAYDYMLETAQAVARNLDGDVLDESRSVITKQATEHARQQIRELEQRLLAQTR